MKTFGRRAWTKRRGSALVFTSIMMVAITTVVIGTVQVNMVAATKADQRIAQELAEQTFDAQTALVTAISKDQSITLPHAFDCLINGYKMTCTVSDNSASELRTVKLTAVGTFKGKIFRYSRILGGRQTTHPFYYSVWANNNVDFSTNAISTNGSVFANGTLNLGTSTVSGDAQATSTVTSASATVDRNTYANAFTQSLPGIVRTNYSTIKENMLDPATLASVPFVTALIGGRYGVKYYANADKVSGLISGKGTAVFEKNVDVTANMAYSLGSDRVVFIVDGNLKIRKEVDRLDGYWYVTGKVDMEATSTPLVMARGAIACGNTWNADRPLNITHDQAFWYDRVEAQRHCVPGFWPTPATGILR